MVRDFTYIDDIVEGVIRVIDSAPRGDPQWDAERPDPARSRSPFRVYNIGNSAPVELLKYIEVLEGALGKKARLDLLPMQAGDVEVTVSDTTELEHNLGYRPNTPVAVGVARFVEWYKDYFRVG
jgi:UDP-glucuronate 4-epimerase